MQSKQIVMAVVAVVVIIGATVYIVRKLGSSGETGDPVAVWVCDSCGHEDEFPLENQSPDCPKCPEGQMVQRQYFKCKKCGEAFEAYQTNWSPLAPRAADVKEEADRSGKLAAGVRPEESQLVRESGGKWAWRESPKGSRIARQFECPGCKTSKLKDFEKIMKPPAKK